MAGSWPPIIISKLFVSDVGMPLPSTRYFSSAAFHARLGVPVAFSRGVELDGAASRYGAVDLVLILDCLALGAGEAATDRRPQDWNTADVGSRTPRSGHAVVKRHARIVALLNRILVVLLNLGANLFGAPMCNV
ncbi:hypothetical protein LB542_05060 [Mesorhizobium sp. BR1-1-9]|uniref:hypothetical protein n=1 Tax=Mesorhizobium sp. BR1-1-9 TaxID=2876646 RepID=UPI001CD0DB0C|nr:hypothetical protein [Mesorhizobium sp. BR1-1-9]MBZ9870234.1 hypothetical protein [Mesorhizobium sp. BR1-1-9]